MNSAWIQHEFDMNSTPLLCKVLRKALRKFKVKMKSAWIQHEFDMNSTPLLCKVLRKALWKFKVKMKSAWIQHEFGMNSTPIWFQLLYKALWKRVCTNHFQCIIICLFPIYIWIKSLTVLPKKHGLAPNSKPPTQTTSFVFVEYLALRKQSWNDWRFKKSRRSKSPKQRSWSWKKFGSALVLV